MVTGTASGVKVAPFKLTLYGDPSDRIWSCGPNTGATFPKAGYACPCPVVSKTIEYPCVVVLNEEV